MPPNSDWQPSRSELWNAVETKNKRKDSQTAREVEIALPFELSDDERWNLISDFSKALVSRYEVAADAVIHAPRGDNKNYHGHILLTTNRIEGNTVGGKNRDMNSREELEHIRGMWADCTNQALTRAGHNVRIDHRTLKEQGIDREATQHEGVSATALERKGVRTRVREENLRRKAQEQERQNIKRAIAAVSVDIQKLQQEKAKVEAELNAKKLKQRHYQERCEILGEIRKLKREKNFDWKRYWKDWKELRLDFKLLVAEQLREKLRLSAEIDVQKRALEDTQKKQKTAAWAQKQIVQQPKIEISEPVPERPKFATWQDKLGWRKLHPLTEEECEKLLGIQREEKLLAQKMSPEEAKRLIEKKYPEESQDLEIWSYNMERKKAAQEAANAKKDVKPILPIPAPDIDEHTTEEPEEAKVVEKTLDERMTMAKDSAAWIVPRQNVHEALDSKPYRGTFVKIIEGVILLQTRKDEIVLVSDDTLAKNPEVGDKINISPIRNVGDKRDVSLIERGHGR